MGGKKAMGYKILNNLWPFLKWLQIIGLNPLQKDGDLIESLSNIQYLMAYIRAIVIQTIMYFSVHMYFKYSVNVSLMDLLSIYQDFFTDGVNTFCYFGVSLVLWSMHFGLLWIHFSIKNELAVVISFLRDQTR